MALCLAGALHVRNGRPEALRERTPDNWTYYGGDARNWRYKPYDQINAANFRQPGWLPGAFAPTNLGPSPDFNLGATPIMANG